MNHAKHIFHTPLYTYPSSHNHTQSKQITRETSKVQCIAQSRPASRSGWGASLRRDMLAQASLPSPRREYKNTYVGITGSRLSEIPLAWASCLLAQKMSEPPRRDFAQRPPCFISPRRDWLAWARLTGVATVLHCISHENEANHTCKLFTRIKTKKQTVYPTINSHTDQRMTQNLRL